MVLNNNMTFFDTNYGEFASITGTNLDTSTAQYAYDNRPTPFVNFNSTSGEFIADFGASTFWSNRLLLANHNLQNFSFAINTGSAWDTVTTYTNNTETTVVFSLTSTLPISDYKVIFSTTIDSLAGYFGEFILTKEKFQLNYNPNSYVPKMIPVGVEKTLWGGKKVFNRRDDVFNADIGWTFLQGDPNTLTNTDLQNVTELFRKNTSFLFWPNANNDFVNMKTWRKEDIFKCKVIDSVSYEFPAPNLDYIVKAKYTIQEAN